MRRHHRAAYLAPRRHHDDNNLLPNHHELSVPLLVEIKHNESPVVVSPPSSVESEVSFDHHYNDFDAIPLPPPPRLVRSKRRSSWRKRRLVKTIIRLYQLLLDCLLLLFVCVMGLFFDVEVQVVRQDRRRGGRGSGRVVIQTTNGRNKNNNSYENGGNPYGRHGHHRASNLLRNQPESLGGGGEDWYHNLVSREEIV